MPDSAHRSLFPGILPAFGFTPSVIDGLSRVFYDLSLLYRYQTTLLAVTNDNKTSLIVDGRHSIFGRICRLPRNTPASQALRLSIDAFTGIPPAADWKRSLHQVVRNNWLQQTEEDTSLSVTACQLASLDRTLSRSLRPSAGQAQLSVSDCSQSD